MVHVRHARGKWYVVVPHPGGARLANGKPKYVSQQIDAKSRAEAEQVAKALERRKSALLSPEPEARTVRVEAADWLARIERRGQRNIRVRRQHLDKWILPRLGHLLVTDVRKATVIDWVDDIRAEEHGLSGATVRNIYGTLRSLFSDLETREVIESTPCRLPQHYLPPGRSSNDPWYAEHVYTRAEVELILRDPSRMRAGYALGFLAGLRAGEVCGLRWADIDRTTKPLWRITISRSYAGKTKTGDVRVVPAHPVLAQILRETPREGELVVSQVDGRMMTQAAMHNVWSRYLKSIEVRRLRFHDTRRTWSTLMRQDGALPHVVDRMGWKPNRGKMVERYSEVGWDEMVEAVQRLDINLRRGAVVELRGAKEG